jgi:hypothetical protein
MKAVFVGIIDSNNLYYVLDSRDPNTDGVIVEGGKPKVISFWQTVLAAQNVKKASGNAFLDLLWKTPKKEDEDGWHQIFIDKALPIDEKLLEGSSIRTDIMNSKIKAKSVSERVDTFKTLLQTQNVIILRDHMKKVL